MPIRYIFDPKGEVLLIFQFTNREMEDQIDGLNSMVRKLEFFSPLLDENDGGKIGPGITREGVTTEDEVHPIGGDVGMIRGGGTEDTIEMLVSHTHLTLASSVLAGLLQDCTIEEAEQLQNPGLIEYTIPLQHVDPYAMAAAMAIIHLKKVPRSLELPNLESFAWLVNEYFVKRLDHFRAVAKHWIQDSWSVADYLPPNSPPVYRLRSWLNISCVFKVPGLFKEVTKAGIISYGDIWGLGFFCSEDARRRTIPHEKIKQARNLAIGKALSILCDYRNTYEAKIKDLTDDPSKEEVLCMFCATAMLRGLNQSLAIRHLNPRALPSPPYKDWTYAKIVETIILAVECVPTHCSELHKYKYKDNKEMHRAHKLEDYSLKSRLKDLTDSIEGLDLPTGGEQNPRPKPRNDLRLPWISSFAESL